MGSGFGPRRPPPGCRGAGWLFFGTVLMQEFRDFGVSLPLCQRQRRLVLLVSSICVGAFGNKQFNHVLMARLARCVQWRLIVALSGVDTEERQSA